MSWRSSAPGAAQQPGAQTHLLLRQEQSRMTHSLSEYQETQIDKAPRSRPGTGFRRARSSFCFFASGESSRLAVPPSGLRSRCPPGLQPCWVGLQHLAPVPAVPSSGLLSAGRPASSPARYPGYGAAAGLPTCSTTFPATDGLIFARLDAVLSGLRAIPCHTGRCRLIPVSSS
jgi:hypothetical protein